MHSKPSRRPASLRLSSTLLAAGLALGALAPAAAASSVTEAGRVETAGGSVTLAAAPRAKSTVTPARCAETFHAAFADILAGPYAALKAAAMAPAATDAGARPSDLPGALVFAPPPRPRSTTEAAALRSAASLARRGARMGAAPADANARWVAARIREDLADFLTQGPSPYLCSGIDNYLTTLKRQADTIAIGPDRRAGDLAVQTEAARQSLKSALDALKPVPVPVAAPADRPDAGIVAQTLRSTVGLGREAMGPPMLMANRGDEASRLSEGQTDPDLPPLGLDETRALSSEADILAAVDRLAGAIEAAGLFAPAPQADPAPSLDAGPTDSVITGSVAPAAPPRPVIARLAEIRPRLATTASPIRDPRLRLALQGAFADLEALDYLRVAALEPADPLRAAMSATFEAIAAAHAKACDCRP
ncbi:hypothetical protein [Aureimonas pseudogalii]|uniref:Uncharacterized protein n=1 Tax=Aureimonas pseudogalii TaxID=1744844 RepID=A0A7W6ECX9_9HYPH|nr:hypothetical protein [Aureimonas pseudogalii]MBB3997002.1 hypothetical protein [Aureimonas pseudogalii]